MCQYFFYFNNVEDDRNVRDTCDFNIIRLYNYELNSYFIDKIESNICNINKRTKIVMLFFKF